MRRIRLWMARKRDGSDGQDDDNSKEKSSISLPAENPPSLKIPSMEEEKSKNTSPSSSAASPPKLMLNQYYLGERIGQGHFGRVKVGVDKFTGQKYALKMQIKSKEFDADDFRREASTLMMFDHPNIIKCFRSEENALYPVKDRFEEVLLLVLEICDQGQLFDVLKYAGGFKEIIARSYFHQLIEGLEELHSKGIVHRDLKLENLLLSSDYVLKIGDFGLSTGGIFSDTEEMTQGCGTPLYKAPEINEGRPYTRKVDIFACGVILFIMVSGYPPYKRAEVEDPYYEPIASGEYGKFWKAHSRAKFSSSLKELVQGMLDYNPETRLNLDQVKSSTWYKGEIMEQKDLAAELSKTKSVVIEGKKADNRSPRSSKKSILNKLDDSDSLAHRSLETLHTMFSDRLPDQFDADLGVNVMTRIKCAVDWKTAFMGASTFAAIHRYQFEFDEEEFELIVHVKLLSEDDPSLMEEVDICVKVYETANPDMSVLTVRRLSGSTFEFLKVFDKLATHFNAVIVN